jgi:hypothetical protein
MKKTKLKIIRPSIRACRSKRCGSLCISYEKMETTITVKAAA